LASNTRFLLFAYSVFICAAENFSYSLKYDSIVRCTPAFRLSSSVVNKLSIPFAIDNFNRVTKRSNFNVFSPKVSSRFASSCRNCCVWPCDVCNAVDTEPSSNLAKSPVISFTRLVSSPRPFMFNPRRFNSGEVLPIIEFTSISLAVVTSVPNLAANSIAIGMSLESCSSVTFVPSINLACAAKISSLSNKFWYFFANSSA